MFIRSSFHMYLDITVPAGMNLSVKSGKAPRISHPLG